MPVVVTAGLNRVPASDVNKPLPVTVSEVKGVPGPICPGPTLIIPLLFNVKLAAPLIIPVNVISPVPALNAIVEPFANVGKGALNI